MAEPNATAAQPPAAPAAHTAAPAAPSADAPPAWAQALIAKVDSLEGVKSKLEADLGAERSKTAEAEKQKMTLEERFAASERERLGDKIDASLMREFGRHNYTNDVAYDHALAVFRASHRVEIKDGAPLAIGADGKPQHLAQAANAWLKGPGAMYLAAPAQPGAGAPNPASPDSRSKGIADMTRAEFNAALAGGMKVRLTSDPRSPIVTIRRKGNPYEDFRKANKGGSA